MRPVESDLLGIGEMSRASGLTVSALRFYDGAGLLVPAFVDPSTGYRSYRPEQVPAARLLANLRRVAMPLSEVARVLRAETPREAFDVLDGHLHRLESNLADARLVLSRVRTLLDERENLMTDTIPGATATVPGAALAAAVDRVRFAVSRDPDLPALAGVLVEVGDDAVRLAATDRYRLAVAEAGGRVDEPRAAVLVGADGVDRLRGALDGDRAAHVEVTSHALVVRVGDEVHRLPALEHDFPSYRALVPSAPARRVPMDVLGLRTGLAGGEVPDVVRLAVTGDLVELDGAEGDLVVGVDPTFLLQAIDAGGSDRLLLELDGPLAPLTIRPVDDDSGFSLLMPVRLDA